MNASDEVRVQGTMCHRLVVTSRVPARRVGSVRPCLPRSLACQTTSALWCLCCLLPTLLTLLRSSWGTTSCRTLWITVSVATRMPQTRIGHRGDCLLREENAIFFPWFFGRVSAEDLPRPTASRLARGEYARKVLLWVMLMIAMLNFHYNLGHPARAGSLRSGPPTEPQYAALSACTRPLT